jgi:DNA-binding MarR family transcriptional regulator
MENLLLKCGRTSLVGLGTMMVGRSVTMYLDRGVRGSGLTINQIYIMFLIDKLRGENISTIARKCVMHRTNLTKSLSGLKEYIVIHANKGKDGRNSYPALTNKGADILEKWMPRVIELEKGLQIPTGDSESFIKFINFFSTELADLNKSNLPIPE